MRAVVRVQRLEPDHVRTLLNRSASETRTGVDYQVRNYRGLRRLQADVKEKRQAQSLSPPQPFKLARFARVGALVFKDKQEVEKLREDRRTQLSLARAQKPWDQVIKLSHAPHNYVLENAKEALRAPKALPTQTQVSAKSLNPSYGQVPAYLRKYIAVAEEERKRRKEAEESRCPPGMRLLSEGERSGLYEALIKERQVTLLALNRIPLGASAPSILKRKSGLERGLEELEKALQTFSRPKVFVAA